MLQPKKAIKNNKVQYHNCSHRFCLQQSLFDVLFFYLKKKTQKCYQNLILHQTKSCSSHRSIFTCESMPLPSDLATHWSISGQSALIPSSFKELFFLALFGSQPAEQIAQDQQRRKISPVACHGNPALAIFTEDNCCHRYPQKKITAATNYTHKRTNTATCNTLKN